MNIKQDLNKKKPHNKCKRRANSIMTNFRNLLITINPQFKVFTYKFENKKDIIAYLLVPQ